MRSLQYELNSQFDFSKKKMWFFLFIFYARIDYFN